MPIDDAYRQPSTNSDGVSAPSADTVSMFDDSLISNRDMFNPFDKDTNPQHATFFLNDESWKLQVGPIVLDIPPQSLRVSRNYSNVAAAYVMRAKTSSKLSPGRYTRVVEMNLTFPSIDDVWDGANSLRMLITLFRTCPFLPVRQACLNDVFGIDALSLVSMSINTVPGLPETISVNLICYEFNWKAYVPVAGTFWDAFDPQRFQVHLNRSIESIDAYSKMPFKTERSNPELRPDGKVRTDIGTGAEARIWEAQVERLFGPRQPVSAVSDLELYYSDRNYSSELWLNKINVYDQVVSPNVMGSWYDIVKNSIFVTILDAFMGEGDSLKENLLKEFQSRFSSDVESTRSYAAFTALCSLSEFWLNNEGGDKKFYESALSKLRTLNPSADPEMLRRLAYFYVAQQKKEMILGDGRIIEALRDPRLRWIPEWEIPLRRMGLLNHDLKKQVIVESVSVASQNAIMAMPLAGKTTPTHQHLGNMGTSATITLKVFGERALTYLNEILDAIDLSALRNKASGVTGFLGIENDLINVMGMQYGLIDKFDVQTIPGVPHVYQVVINMSDFDILQQKREQPTPVERMSLMDQMSKGHPMMRARQVLSQMNAYPDLPLPRTKVLKTVFSPVKNTEKNPDGTVQPDTYKADLLEMPGQYYDPDYYFRQAIFYENGTNAGAGEPMYDEGTHTYVYPGNSTSREVDGTFKSDWNHPDVPVTLSAQNDIDATVKIKRADKADGINMSAEIESKLNPAEIAKEYEGIPLNKRIDRTYTAGAEHAQIMFYLNSEEGQKLSEEEKKLWISRAGTYTPGQNQPVNLLEMLDEQRFSSTDGRMVKAFPTCIVYLIDEGDNVLMYRLHDTFYGMQALISAQVMIDKEAPLDSAILSFSNVYNKLSTPQWYESWAMPKFVYDVIANSQFTLQRIGGMVLSLDHTRIQTGMRVQVRFGYSANPEALPIVFNGTIAEVSDGPVLTVVAQGDGAELSVVSAANFSSKASTSYFHDWLRGRAFVEPQDLIIKYMAAYGGAWQEFIKRSSANLSNPGDIAAAAHFGACLWDTTLFGGDSAFKAQQKKTIDKIRVHLERAGKKVQDAGAMSILSGEILGMFPETSADVIGQGIENFSKLVPDFELYKRNIYPGNITGMRDFGPPAGMHHNVWKTVMHSLLDKAYSPADDPAQDTDNKATDERPAHFNTGGKTNWEIMKMCEAMMPNYVLAVRPFEHRSTLFYGKQNWLYTSGVVPVFQGDNATTLKVGKPTEMEVAQSIVSSLPDAPQQNSYAGTWFTGGADHGQTNAIKTKKGWARWVFTWLTDSTGLPQHEVLKRLNGKYPSQAAFDEEWAKFIQFAVGEPLVTDFMTWQIGSCRRLYVWADSKKQQEYLNKQFPGNRGTVNAVEGSRHYPDDSLPHNSGDQLVCSDDASGLLTQVSSTESWRWSVDLFNAWKKGVDSVKDLPKEREEILAGTGEKKTIKINDPEEAARKEVAKVLRQAKDTTWLSEQTRSGDINKDAWEQELKELEAGKKSGVTITDAAKKDAGSDKSSGGSIIKQKIDAMDATQFAIADILLLKADGLEGALTASGMLDGQAIAQWAYLNDNTYYGMDQDNVFKYPGSQWIDKPFDPKTGAEETYKPGTPQDIVMSRKLMRLTDNPFSKEFGEPVVEIREPFARFHSIMSETNLVANTLYEDESNVANVVRAFAHNGSGNDGKKELTIRADRSIPPNLVKEKVYDTGYNYDWANVYDQANHRAMGLNALKRSLQQMYGGELIILGDGNIRPYDYVWLWDTQNKMNGNCEVERVTHHFGLDTGFITTVKVAPIIAIDDTFAFSMWDYLFPLTNRQQALQYAAMNKATGFVDNSQEVSEKQMAERSEIARQTLGVTDGLTGSYKTYGVGSMISMFMDGDFMNPNDKATDEKKKAAEDLKKEDETQLAVSVSIAGAIAIGLGLALFTGGISLGVALGYTAATLAGMAAVNKMIDDQQIDTYGKTLGEALVKNKETVEFNKLMFWTTCIELLGAEKLLGLVFLFFGAKAFENGLTFLIEEEPIKVITLMKDGEPFQAGLRGARGIINGQPGTIPILSDLLGLEVPGDLESGIWMEFGYTFEDGQMLSISRNLAEHRMAKKLIETGMRAEEIIDDGLGGARVVFTANVLDVLDGDTIIIDAASLPDVKGVSDWKSKINIKQLDGRPVAHIRMKYIDAPETEKSYEGAARPEYGGEGCKKWLKDKLSSSGNKITIIANPIGHTDDYGRLVAFIALGNKTEYFSGKFDWFKDTVNGWMVDPSRNELIDVESPSGSIVKQKISNFVLPLFTIPAIDRVNTKW